ncbi:MULTISPECIES: pyridoxal phosphate-dependent aminotransferase [Streptomyces]|uniref:Aminotransferase n=1 Tax=Streptomyces chartreusis NRRL 3882 TaxID=1079985 RepID=A0A2N9B218_STRCX|nr:MULTISPECIES: pyridoxal phosphate-dependent aminotransferase [Streptomyces]MYS92363.1 aminotransferase class I/II-fold pyridoxal phosphate-dependent enzyme [Streptomyces sp. SID5464]SOR77377.1 Aspartate aminotransferase [Streptomyces chartreusis NRRL 3882]
MVHAQQQSTLAFREALRHMRTQRIVEVNRVCRDYPDAISLCFGESDLPTPAVVRQAAASAMEAGKTLYADRRGIAPLRSAIQAYHKRTHGLDLDSERISATSSGMTSIMIALQCLVEPGDNVVVVAPVWPNVPIAVESMGATVRFVGLDASPEGWSLDLSRVDDACDDRTRAVFVASPGNPTGWTLTSAEQRALLDLARRRGTWVIADEVYNRIVYDGSVATPSFLEVAHDDDALFVVQSFSKTWSMTGWRLGWLVHPAALAHQVGNLSAINSTGSATFVQHAGVAAIHEGEPFVEEMRARCALGRDLVMDALKGNDRFRVPHVPAAFYSFFRIDGVDDDLEYAKQLVARAGVGLAPGTAFGPGYEGYFRICFAQSPERLSKALDRLVAAV